MSERLNSVDIEDVLSSIRRLVSDDKRPMAQGAAPVAGPVTGPVPGPAASPAAAGTKPVVDPQADKLILTPALRIAPEPEPAVDPAADAAPLAAADAPMAFSSIRADRRAPPATARLDAVMGEVARGLDSGQGEWEAPAEPPSHFASDWSAGPEKHSAAQAADAWPDASTDGVGDTGGDTGPEAPFADLSAEPDIDLGGAHGAGEVLAAGAWDDLSARPGEVDVLHGAEAGAEDRLPGSWPTPDWPAPDLLTPNWAEPAPAAALADATAPAWDAPEWTAPDLTAAEPISPVAMAEEAAMIDKDDPDTLTPRMARAGDAAADDLPDWASEEAGAPTRPEPDPAARDPRWADAAEAEIRRELEEEVTASAFARFADDDLDDRPFDEDMLRDLVRDIIREELQGALGERITRNVRKLVRAEIARALAVRDFE